MTTNYLLPGPNLPPGRGGRQTALRAAQEVAGRIQPGELPSKSSTNADVALRIAERMREGLPGDPGCPHCGGIGYVRGDYAPGHPDFGKAQACTCLNRKTATRVQTLNRMRPAEQSIRLADIDLAVGENGTRRMVAAARAFLADPTGMLTICGSPGNAKSMALMAVVNELIERGVPALYITMFDLVGYVRQAFYRDAHGNLLVGSEDAYSRLKWFAGVQVLAVDEFDKVKLTDWVLEQMTDLVDERYRSAETRGTLIAMNAGVQQLPEWIASRLLDGRNRLVVNQDADLRPDLRR